MSAEVAALASAVAAAASSAASAPAAPTPKGIELLYDYTKFHIGVYLTLASSFIAVSGIKLNDKFALPVHPWLLLFAALCFMIAGWAGGVIVSSITQCYDVGVKGSCLTTQSFLDQPIGPYNWTPLTARKWTWIEHTSFWVGLGLALASLLVVRLESFKSANPAKKSEQDVALEEDG